jgi:archaemetzincin
VEQHPPGFDPEVAFDASRGQHNSRIMLTQLLETASRKADRILGVTSVDLFIPVLTYVFGEAQLDGRAAVISFHRLDNQVYGLPPAPDVLFDRLCKEALHELGHTYNLLHCHDDRCVMASSTYVEGIDLKLGQFCRSCLEMIRVRTGTGATQGRPHPEHEA